MKTKTDPQVEQLRAALELIADVEVNSNSDPDRMGDALDYIDNVARAALDGKPMPAFSPNGPFHVCDNCGEEWHEDALVEAKDLAERVDPGGEMPSGECPDCGCLCYPFKE